MPNDPTSVLHYLKDPAISYSCSTTAKALDSRKSSVNACLEFLSKPINNFVMQQIKTIFENVINFCNLHYLNPDEKPCAPVMRFFSEDGQVNVNVAAQKAGVILNSDFKLTSYGPIVNFKFALDGPFTKLLTPALPNKESSILTVSEPKEMLKQLVIPGSLNTILPLDQPTKYVKILRANAEDLYLARYSDEYESTKPIRNEQSNAQNTDALLLYKKTSNKASAYPINHLSGFLFAIQHNFVNSTKAYFNTGLKLDAQSALSTIAEVKLEIFDYIIQHVEKSDLDDKLFEAYKIQGHEVPKSDLAIKALIYNENRGLEFLESYLRAYSEHSFSHLRDGTSKYFHYKLFESYPKIAEMLIKHYLNKSDDLKLYSSICIQGLNPSAFTAKSSCASSKGIEDINCQKAIADVTELIFNPDKDLSQLEFYLETRSAYPFDQLNEQNILKTLAQKALKNYPKIKKFLGCDEPALEVNGLLFKAPKTSSRKER